MKKMKKVLLFLFVLLLIGVTWFYNHLSKKEILSTNEKTEVLTFANEKKVYIRAKIWGGSGNHEEIVFSENPITIPNKENDYIFYTNEVVYQVENNTLRLYGCECDLSVPTTPFKNIDVVFKNLKTEDKIKDYNTNYQRYEMKRISIYE